MDLMCQNIYHTLVFVHEVMFLSKRRGHTFSRLNCAGCVFPLFIFSISICRSYIFCVTTSSGDSSLSHFMLVTSKLDGNFAPFCAIANM